MKNAVLASILIVGTVPAHAHSADSPARPFFIPDASIGKCAEIIAREMGVSISVVFDDDLGGDVAFYGMPPTTIIEILGSVTPGTFDRRYWGYSYNGKRSDVAFCGFITEYWLVNADLVEAANMFAKARRVPRPRIEAGHYQKVTLSGKMEDLPDAFARTVHHANGSGLGIEGDLWAWQRRYTRVIPFSPQSLQSRLPDRENAWKATVGEALAVILGSNDIPYFALGDLSKAVTLDPSSSMTVENALLELSSKVGIDYRFTPQGLIFGIPTTKATD